MKKNIISPFIELIWDIVSDPSLDHILSWSPNGTSFCIHNQELFSQDILARHFKHSNLSSFIRQVLALQCSLTCITSTRTKRIQSSWNFSINFFGEMPSNDFVIPQRNYYRDQAQTFIGGSKVRRGTAQTVPNPKILSHSWKQISRVRRTVRLGQRQREYGYRLVQSKTGNRDNRSGDGKRDWEWRACESGGHCARDAEDCPQCTYRPIFRLYWSINLMRYEPGRMEIDGYLIVNYYLFWDWVMGYRRDHGQNTTS